MRRTIIGGTVLLGVLWCLSNGAAQVGRGGEGPTGKTRLINSIEGPDLYKAYCASCHGTDARGRGPVAKSLKVPPSDLTRISAHSGGVFPLERITRIISGEEQVDAGHGTREMPVWGPIFSYVESDRDFGRVRIDNLARYLRQLQRQ
jgi:mono/diheme cytochrome c family protein